MDHAATMPDPAAKTDSGWHFVLIRDGLARTVAESEFGQVAKLEADGWAVVWDSATSRADGLARALETSGALPDDSYRPRAMTEPRVLFRSVSLPELLDVFRTGSVVGRGNAFNGLDGRRHVFFGAALTGKLIGQGEDAERQASAALAGHAIHGRFAAAEAELAGLRVQALRVFADEVEAVNRIRSRHGEKPVEVNGAALERARHGGASAIAALSQAVPKRNLWPLLDRMQEVEARQGQLQERYLEMLGQRAARIRAANTGKPFTSAILRTSPIAGGLHYSEAHGKSGMGAEDEFGFPSAQVTLADIDSVMLVRDGRVAWDGRPDKVKAAIQRATRAIAQAPAAAPAPGQR